MTTSTYAFEPTRPVMLSPIAGENFESYEVRSSQGTLDISVVCGNGFCEGPKTWSPLARRLLQAARTNDIGLQITSYDDAYLGRQQEANLEKRARHFGEVVLAVADEADSVVALTHSRGWETFLLAMQAEAVAEKISGVAALNLPGHVARRKEDLTMANGIRVFGQEVWRGRNLSLDTLRPSGIRAHLQIARNAGRSVLAGTFASEAKEILLADVTPQAVELSSRPGFRMAVAIGSRDSLCPGTPTKETLLAAGFRGEVQDFDTGHMGIIINSQFAGNVFDMVCKAGGVQRVS